LWQLLLPASWYYQPASTVLSSFTLCGRDICVSAAPKAYLHNVRGIFACCATNCRFSCYRQACLRKAQPCRYCFTQWSKNRFFAPQGRHVAPINVKFGTVRSPVPNFTYHVPNFIRAEMWECSPKTVKSSIFGQKFVPQGRLVCSIFTKFSAFVRVYRLLLSF